MEDKMSKITRTLYWIKNHSAMNVVECNNYTDYLLTTELDTWEVYNTKFKTGDVESIVISEEDVEIILKDGYNAKQ